MTGAQGLFNRDRAQTLLRENELDAMLAGLPENWLYLTGQEDAIASTLGLRTFALLTSQPFGLGAVAVPRLSAGVSGAVAAVDEVVVYGDFPVSVSSRDLGEIERRTATILEDESRAAASMPDALELMLKRAGLEHGRIALDDWSVAPVLQERLPDCRCVPGAKLFDQIRAVKTPEEIARLRAAARIVEQLELAAFEHARAGHVWDDFVLDLPRAAAERGAKLGFFSGGASWRSGFMFPPENEPLGLGDLIRLDITISHRGYWADSGRTASLGPAGEEARDRYKTIRAAVDAATEVARPGTSFAQVYWAAMQVAQLAMPEYRRRHCGHTIGARPYDGLLVAPDETALLEENMVINIEVPYYGIGWGGLQLEDTLLITDSGSSPLTTLPRELVELQA